MAEVFQASLDPDVVIRVSYFVQRVAVPFIRHGGDRDQLEQINFEKVYLLCKDLSVKPCRADALGELCLPLSKHLKVKMLLIVSSNYSRPQ